MLSDLYSHYTHNLGKKSYLSKWLLSKYMRLKCLNTIMFGHCQVIPESKHYAENELHTRFVEGILYQVFPQFHVIMLLAEGNCLFNVTKFLCYQNQCLLCIPNTACKQVTFYSHNSVWIIKQEHRMHDKKKKKNEYRNFWWKISRKDIRWETQAFGRKTWNDDLK